MTDIPAGIGIGSSGRLAAFARHQVTIVLLSYGEERHVLNIMMAHEPVFWSRSWTT